MMCAKPSMSNCWEDEGNIVSNEADIGLDKKGEKHGVSMLFNDLSSEAEVVVHVVVSGIIVWGLLSWFDVVKAMKEILGPFL